MAVRERDFAAGEALFCPCVHSFGTVVDVTSSLAELRAHQWQQVWPLTRDFCFYDAHFLWSDENAPSQVAVLACWRSYALHQGDLESESDGERTGRVTLILQFDSQKQEFLAVHSHFSRARHHCAPQETKG